jgi:hypothetical protein
MTENLTAEQRQALDTLARLVESPTQLVSNANGEPTAIQLFQRGVTDREMECFRHFNEFESIGVGGCSGVTDAGLQFIAHLRKLSFLDLQETGVTDAGLFHLAGLTNLRHLYLNCLPITDTGIRHLERLAKLKKLVIDEDGIGHDAYERLLTAIPGLEVTNY